MNTEVLVFFLGVLVSLLGFTINEFVFRPIATFKKHIVNIGVELTYFSQIITSPAPSELADEASPVIRRLAVELERKYLQIPILGLFQSVGMVPQKDKIELAKGQLISISNSVHSEDSNEKNIEKLNSIFSELGIKELTKRYNINNG